MHTANGVEDERTWKDICYRHPGVQLELLNRLSLNRCSAVNHGELYRITALSLQDSSLIAGGGHDALVAYDFAGLVNLEHLGINLPNGLGLSPGVFQHLTQLRTLNISGTVTLNPGVFEGTGNLEELYVHEFDSLNPGALDGLGRLKKLEFSLRDYDYPSEASPVLTAAFLKGMDSLQYLEARDVGIDSGALDASPNLRYLSFSEEIPPNLLVNLDKLRKIYARSSGTSLELASLEVACAISLYGEPVLVVNGEVVVVRSRKSEPERDSLVCDIEVGQRQVEVRVNDLWEGYWK